MTSPAPSLNESPPPAGWSRRPAGMVVQIVLFLACLGLLAWCVAKVLSPDNRANLARLAEASSGQIASMLGLSVASLLLSGVAFRQALTPVRVLPMREVQAVNAIAGLLALLPFKLSVVVRVVIHNRRHGVPVLTAGAWFGAVAAIMGAVLGPVILVSLWRGRLDGVWWLACLGGIGACLGVLILLARLTSGERGWAVVRTVWARVPMPGSVRQSTLLERVHEGVRMLASPWAVCSCAAARLADVFVQTARFLVAGAIVGQTIPDVQGVIAGGTYFLIGAAAPAGQLGAREGGTAWILEALFPAHDLSRILTAVVAISAADIIVIALGALLSTIFLRPDRLLRRPSGRAPAH